MFMTVPRLLGLAIAAGGIVFLIIGINATDAPFEQFHDALFGRYSQDTVMYIAGGIGAIVAGLVVVIAAPR